MAVGCLELWAGPECSVVRVGDRFVDQLELTGHARRLADLDLLAALGVRAVRQPVLWERTWPGETPDWSFADERLARLRELEVRPIVGLVHHGSGPLHTSLLEGSFVTGLARFASAVAERYPWVTDWTPVNEPLTTARFSALYGHWYPHARSDRDFVRALTIQAEATRAAMQAIREVVPSARLVQTEDLGTVFATPKLAYQAAFENERRFVSLDLLAGRVDGAHALRDWLLGCGADPAVLDSLVETPCLPDVVGVNHYLTSDRFLDEHVGRYPVHVRGGNASEAYADVEAVRVRGDAIPGHGALLELLWARYHLPLAVTEVHLACAPEEQVRWLYEAWTSAEAARGSGVDVRAVTAWTAFGAYDWDTLLTRPSGRYEPGLFDVRGHEVRPTALAAVARDLATRAASDHPMLEEPGWWRRLTRVHYPPFGHVVSSPPATQRPVLVTGGGGTLGRAFAQVCAWRGLRAVVMTRAELDIADRDAVAEALDTHQPWAVVNAAGYVRVDDAELDVERCFRENVDGPRVLAEACAARDLRFATFSSDLVFDGQKEAPYVENDGVAPLGVYGASKAEAERVVLDILPRALVARTSAFFGPWDESSFVARALAELGAGRRFRAEADVFVSPTYVPDLAEATLTLLVDGGEGLFHLAAPEVLSWSELARRAAERAGVRTDRLVACSARDHARRAARPRYSALASTRASLLPTLDDALRRFVDALATASRLEESG